MKRNKLTAIIFGCVLMTAALVTPVFANVPPVEETAAQEETEVTASRIGEDINKDSMPTEEVTGADGQVTETEDQSLTPDGNMTIVDDIITDGGKQFITLTTRSGHYYYLIIDRTGNGTQNVYFLNQVDERDLYLQMNEADQKEIDKEKEEAAEKAAAEEAQRKAEEERRAAEEAKAAQEAAESEKDGSDPTSKSTPVSQEQYIRIGNKEIPLKAAIAVTGAAAVLLIILTVIAFRKHNAVKAQVPDPDAGFEDEYDDEYVLEEEEEEDPEDADDKE